MGHRELGGSSVPAAQSLFLPKMTETYQDPTHQEPRASQTPAEAPGRVSARQLGFRYWQGQAAPFPGSSSLSVPVLKQLTLTEGQIHLREEP